MQFSDLTSVLRRYPYSTICAVLTIGFGVLAWVFRHQISDLEVVQQERAKEGEAMLTLLVGGSTQRQELEVVHEVARRIEDNLVVEENLAENYWYFYKLEEQTKARLSVHQVSSPPGNTSTMYKRVPYTVQVAGTFEQVAAFLLGLETGPRLVNITGFSCSRTSATGLALDLSLELLGKK
jgi:Tfp pilus assembly protein PilO